VFNAISMVTGGKTNGLDNYLVINSLLSCD
jgi:hypothetical protein